MRGLDTIVAIATPPGRGAIAIVRASGPEVRDIARRVVRTSAPLADRLAVRGAILDADGATIDEGLALFFAGPRSYTGDDVLELHVHGSPIVARDVLLALVAAGARVAEPGEFTRRAFLAGKLDLAQAEAVGELIAAEHRSSARAAASGLAGGLTRAASRLGETIDAVLEELAGAIDFPDEIRSPTAADLAVRLAPVDAELRALAAAGEAGRIVREGVAVAIVGPPNAGKSSLLNALLGVERALVSESAGTTRDTIEETLSLGDLTARIVDTAGLRDADDPLEAAGIARTRDALANARIALVVVDGSKALSAESEGLLAQTRGRSRVVFYNKSDLGRSAFAARASAEEGALCGSTFDDESVARVRDALRSAALGDATPGAERPYLATARQQGAIAAAQSALAASLDALRRDDPVDLIAGDLFAASRALSSLSGRDASETLLDGIFARFCVGK